MTDKNAQALEALKESIKAEPVEMLAKWRVLELISGALSSAAPAAREVVALTRETMKVGGRYNWRFQNDRLIYLGRNWSGNGYWHQFALVDKPGKVWCEVTDNELVNFEVTAPPAPSETSAEPLGCDETGMSGDPSTYPAHNRPTVTDGEVARNALQAIVNAEHYGADEVVLAKIARDALATLPAVQPEAETSAENAVKRGGSMWHASLQKAIDLCERHGHAGDAATLREIKADAPVAEPVALTDVFLCRAWGESDHPCAELVPDWNGVRDFMVREWLGAADATNYDGTVTLDQLKEDFDEHEQDERGGPYEVIFEIGGVSIERVTGFIHPSTVKEPT